MELLDLQNVFDGKFFRIPDYQRGYSWEVKQCEDLWRDIVFLREGQYHYMGVLSVIQPKKVHEDSDISTDKMVSVVDGQQRITTLIILINAILKSNVVAKKESIHGKNKDYYREKYLFVKMGKQGKIIEPIFGYDEDNPSNPHNPSNIYFRKEILELNEEIYSSVSLRTLYTRNLEAAHKFFVSKIKDLTFKEAEDMLRKIAEQLKFNYYEIDNELNKFIAFETINNRGKPLSNLELLKNRLIYLSTLLPSKYDSNEKDRLRKRIHEAWKTIYEYLGKGEESLNDDEFLRDHFIMNFGYGRGSSKGYKEILLNSRFTAEAVHKKLLGYDDIENYAKDIQRAVKPYFFMHYPEHSHCPYSGDVKKWMSKLSRLGWGTFGPLIIAMLIHKGDDSVVVEILEAVERFCFVAFYVHLHDRDKKRSEIYRFATNFHNKKETLNEVKEKLTLEFLQIPSKESQESFCENVFEKYWDGFYEWRGRHYFLYEYEIDLQKNARGEEKLKWEDVNDETIEHIYPQTPVSGWRKFFSKKADKDLVNDLGNLLLLSQSKNSTIGNGLFADKKEKAFKNGSYSAIEVSRCREWTPKTVNDRRKKMLDFLWRRWGLQKTKE